ncbi:ATP-binding protein [Treponema primitia]|uniref:ATP-binding protein n=1 Tax=Treponema primitia TaxID=88058 RepID=UPI000255579C|nr:ATP-binding protein [Treponema primitia]
MMETLWDYIPRNLYFGRVKPFIGSHIIKILSGQRRSGKSYILYQLMDEIRKVDPKANIIYINTEFAEFRQVKTDGELYDFVASRLSTDRKNFVFIDEIQDIADFEKAVRSLYAEERCDIYCAGSNAHLLSGEFATYLAGRYIQFQIHPLGYREFLSFYDLENSPEALRKYFRIGGMPFLASLPAGEEHLAREYLKNVYESIVLRDVLIRENIRNIRFLENLAEYLADTIGSLFSANNISNYLKHQQVQIPVQTVISYLAALEKSCIIHKVPRAKVGGLKIFEIGEKYYFEDLGLRNVLAKNPPALDMGRLLENAVYLFLIQRNFTVYVGKDGNKEIDFIAEKDGAKLYVQVSLRIDNEEVRRREFGNLEGIPDNFPKYVVTLEDELPAVTPTGIICMGVREFLMLEP